MNMKNVAAALILILGSLYASAQTGNSNYPEDQLAPSYAADTGAVNVLVASPAFGCPTTYAVGKLIRVLPNHANTTTTPTLNYCGLGAKTITKFGTTALVASDMLTTQVAVFIYDGTYMELQVPNTLSTIVGTISAVTVTGPITGGGSSGSVNIACATCVTSAASLTSTALETGAGGQASQTVTGDTVNTGTGIYATYAGITTAGLGFGVVEGISDVTAQSASQTTVNLVASTSAAGHYLVRLYMDQNALCTTGTGSAYATVSWTDASHAHTALTVPLTLANTAISSANGFVDAAIPLWSATASAISYTTTYAACASGTGPYDLHAEVERTN
jgi:hypothetical protein